MGIDGVVVSRCYRRGIVGNGVEINHGVPGDHVKLLWGDVFRGSSLEVLGFLIMFEVVSLVIRTGVGMWFGGFRACEVLLDPSVLVLCLGVVGGSRCRIGDELLRGGCGCRFGWGILGDGVHWCGLGVWVCELWSSAGAQVMGASSGAGAASSRCWLDVGVVLVDPVLLVRR